MRNPSRSRSTVVKTVAATLLATAAFQGTSYAQLLKVGVSFLGRNNDQFLGVDDIAGVVPQQDWNNLAGNTGLTGNTHDGNQFKFQDGGAGPFTSLPLFTDNGAAGTLKPSALTLSVATNDSWNSDGPTATANDKLMKGIIKVGGGQQNSPRTVTVNNLPTGFLYNVIAYTTVNNAGASADFQLTGASAFDKFFITQENSFDGTFTQGTSLDSGARTAEADYVRWDNVAPTATGTFDITWWWQGGGDGAGFTGFQILQLAPPPGPNKFWNVGAGAGAWNTASTNWRDADVAGTSNATFATNDTANFGNLGAAGARTVDVDPAGVTTTGIVVNNTAANNYTIQGGPIHGVATPLTKDGNGTLTLTGANDFFGDATIKHGTVNVTTIGDGALAGNLGSGGNITIGDTTGTNDAKLSYGGATGSWSRNVTVGSNGGEFEVSTAASGVTLTGGLNGTGVFTKSGPGSLTFSGATGNFSGGITVPGGNLSVRQLGVGTGAITLSGGGGLAYTGTSLNDTRNLTLGTGGGTLTVSDANTRYRIGTATATAGNLTVAGAGRLVVSGVANLAANPVINAGATLALTSEAGTNVLPSAISVSNGRLELAPGSFTAATPMTLSGGTLRLGHEGLQGFYYTSAYDTGAWQNSIGGTYRSVGGAFVALGAPLLQARTNTGGQTNLDFGNNNGSADVPFANQGLNAGNTDPDGDNIRVAFTGKILITAAGNTQFFTTSDDGSTIFIDGQRVVNNNAYQGMTERSGTINLTAGLHDIFVTFHEGGGGAGLIANYTPAGGTKQVIPNSVLFAGDTFDSIATPISVTASSGLEIGSSLANLGPLTQSVSTTLTVTGSASFAGTTLGGTGDHGINTASALGSVNLGAITGATGNTITKTGNGALVFSAAAPTGLVVNSNAGVVVVQATKIGVGAQTDPLAGVTVNLNGGGLGFSVAPGSTENSSLTYTNNAVSTNDYKISAGNYFDNPFLAINLATINWNPANNAVNIASTRTATFEVTSPGFTLNVGAPVTGAGALSLDQGNVNFTSATGVAAPGGLTVRAANSNITGPITTGALNVSGSFAGVNGGDLNTPNIGNLHAFSTVGASSVNMNGNTLIVDGVLTNTGAFTQSRGTATLVASTHASVAQTGGTLVSNGNLTSAGAVSLAGTTTVNGALAGAALSVTGGTTTVTGATTASSITVNTNGSLVLKGNVTSPGGATVTNGRTLTFDPGTGNTAVFTGGTVNIDNLAGIVATSGITDMSGSTIHVVTPLVQSTTNNVLRAVQAPVDIGVRAGDAAGANAAMAVAPTISTLLPNGNTATNNGGIDFPNGASDGVFNAFFGATIPDAFTAYFTGTFKARVAGTHNFRFSDNDDAVILIADTNFNGIFDANDTRRNQGCCGGDQNLDVALTVGQELKIAWLLDDGGGGSGLKGYFTEPAGGTVTTSTIVRPGDAAQTGLWSYTQTNGGGGRIDVQSGAELRVKSFDAVSTANLAANSKLSLSNNASSTASGVGTLNLAASSNGSLLLGNNNTVTAGRLTLGTGSALTIDKAPGATNGGVLILDGVVPGLVGTTPSTIGTSNVNVLGGTVLVNAPVTGTGTFLASVAGVLGGNSTIAGPVAVTNGGTVDPGGVTLGTEFGNLGTGDLSFGAGAILKLDISNTLTYDSLSVLGTVALTANPTLQLNLLNFTGALGTVFYILNNDQADAVTGLFNGVADQGTINGPGGSQFQISYDANFGTAFDTGGNDIALKVTQVPEPGSLVALVSGLGMLLGMQRLRRRSV